MNRFRLMRYERGLTLLELVDKTGLAMGTLRRLEGNDTAKPSAPVAKTLADFYGMSVAELLGIEEKAA